MITSFMAPMAMLSLMTAEPTPMVIRPASLSTPVLKQRLAEAQAKMWAWEVEYETARADQCGVPAKSYLHRLVAAKA